MSPTRALSFFLFAKSAVAIMRYNQKIKRKVETMNIKNRLMIRLAIVEGILCIIAGWQLRKVTYERLKSEELILEDGVFDTK